MQLQDPQVISIVFPLARPAAGRPFTAPPHRQGIVARAGKTMSDSPHVTGCQEARFKVHTAAARDAEGRHTQETPGGWKNQVSPALPSDKYPSISDISQEKVTLHGLR